MPEELVSQCVPHSELFPSEKGEQLRRHLAQALNVYSMEELFEQCVKESKSRDKRMRSKLSSDLCTRAGIEFVFKRQVWRPTDILDVDVYFQAKFEDLEMTDDMVIDNTKFIKLVRKLQGAYSSQNQLRPNTKSFIEVSVPLYSWSGL